MIVITNLEKEKKMIKKNPDEAKYKEITAAVEKNNGYCPCLIERSEKTKCICEEFRNQEKGFCRCGRYIKE